MTHTLHSTLPNNKNIFGEPPPEIVVDPGDAPYVSPYTFVDEMWRVHTVTPRRTFVRYSPIEPWLPTRSALVQRFFNFKPLASKAAEEDARLWRKSSSVEKYEKKRRKIQKSRAALLESLGTFPLFQSLPYDLRYLIWKFSIDSQPTQAGIFRSRLNTRANREAQSMDFAAVAVLPPLMLVNREAHKVATEHYHRAFSKFTVRQEQPPPRESFKGLLVRYPTELTVCPAALSLIDDQDLLLIQHLIIDESWLGGGWFITVPEGMRKVTNLAKITLRFRTRSLYNFRGAARRATENFFRKSSAIVEIEYKE